MTTVPPGAVSARPLKVTAWSPTTSAVPFSDMGDDPSLNNSIAGAPSTPLISTAISLIRTADKGGCAATAIQQTRPRGTNSKPRAARPKTDRPGDDPVKARPMYPSHAYVLIVAPCPGSGPAVPVTGSSSGELCP